MTLTMEELRQMEGDQLLEVLTEMAEGTWEQVESRPRVV